MAVDAETIETYDNTVIREDLEQQYTMISPEETPFQTAIGVGPKATATYHEWTVVELATPSTSNRVIEGDDAPGEDAGTLGKRFGNYTQISDKVVSVSNTSEAVDAAAEKAQKPGLRIYNTRNAAGYAVIPCHTNYKVIQKLCLILHQLNCDKDSLEDRLQQSLKDFCI